MSETNKTACPECEARLILTHHTSVSHGINIYKCGCCQYFTLSGNYDDGREIVTPGTFHPNPLISIVQSLKAENEAKASTIRNVFDDLEFGYDNESIQNKMKNKSYSTDKWGNTTSEGGR